MEFSTSLDLDLDLGSGHTAYHYAAFMDLYYTPHFIQIGKTFLTDATLHDWRTSKSRDTKTRPNFKNPALSNLDIVL